MAAAARAGLHIIHSEEGEALAMRLWDNIQKLSESLSLKGLKKPEGAILPLMLGDEEKALEASRQLLEAGIFVPAIRYPTVARGTARLRLTVSAAHTSEQIEHLKSVFKFY